ncbi:MAG: heme exporter protein CcmD [Reinekea sp.]|jgi:heme exporter protein D|nr:heme exporter protein CcmD [Reinekea sp.]
MAFSTIGEFFAMGNHGLYVWSSYAVGAAVILFNVMSPRRLKKKLILDQKRRERREQV